MIRLSRHYYLTNGGWCLRVPMLGKYKADEWPYDVRLMNRCRQSGRHPHTVKGRSRRL